MAAPTINYRIVGAALACLRSQLQNCLTTDASAMVRKDYGLDEAGRLAG